MNVDEFTWHTLIHDIRCIELLFSTLQKDDSIR